MCAYASLYQQEDEDLPNFDNFVIDDDPNEDYNLWRAPNKDEAQSSTDTPTQLMCWEHTSTGFCSSGADCEYLHGDFCQVPNAPLVE